VKAGHSSSFRPWGSRLAPGIHYECIHACSWICSRSLPQQDSSNHAFQSDTLQRVAAHIISGTWREILHVSGAQTATQFYACLIIMTDHPSCGASDFRCVESADPDNLSELLDDNSFPLTKNSSEMACLKSPTHAYPSETCQTDVSSFWSSS
jgi:hypothetical protein